MPPLPSLRYSPGRDRRIEKTHKRGRSFESGLPIKSQDDDLTLFNDMQNRERENFLLHKSDDFEDSISKLRYFSDFKLGITIPVRGESSNLLNADADAEKNDYDWLLTPPDTPLFPSLDDDERQPANLLLSGMPRSQPISISRSSTNERALRTSRGSASPHRLSPSPRSTNSSGQVRGRPSSAPRSCPPPVLRSATPSRRPSTPPSKPSTPPPRSSTPTLRRTSIGSSGPASSSGRRGASPVKASRGNSASPKLRGWQMSIDGFSNDAPPNLRTSLPDRPASHVRGFSPSSRNGRESSSKFGRHSMSPTASRSASSSHSHERDCLSSYSKGSVASSGDDDADSLHCVTVGLSNSHTARKNGAVGNNKAMVISKKPSRAVCASSAPKRSFDSSLRQMEHRKIPQNMFRPLLSSVPATSFYVGKANNIHRPMFSRNSSLTTSSNASSELGVSVAPDMEGSEPDQNDLRGKWERTHDPDNHEEIFIFDKVDETNEDDGHEICTGKPQHNVKEVHIGMANKVDPQELENSPGNAASIVAASESSYAAADHSQVGCNEMMETCTKCQKRFRVVNLNANTNVCQECAEKDGLYTSLGLGTALPADQDQIVQSELATEMDRLCCGKQIGMPEKSGSKIMLNQHEVMDELLPDCLPGCSPHQLVINQREEYHSDQQLDRLKGVNASQSKFHQSQHTGHPNLRIDSPEATGISVLLLQRSSSNKWPFVQGRAFSATNIICSDPSYARDNMNAMKRSIDRDSVSTSSVDLGSSRQTEDHVQPHLSSKKLHIMTADNDAKAQSTGSHAEVSINAHEAAFCPQSGTEECISNFTDAVEYEAFREIVLITEEHEKSLENGKLCATESSSIREAVDRDISVPTDGCLAMNTSDSQLLSHSGRIHLHKTLTIDNLNDEDCTSCVSAEEDLSTISERSIRDIEVLNDILASSVAEEDYMLNSTSPNIKSDSATRSSSFPILEPENNHDSFLDIQSECIPSENPSHMEAFHECSASTASEKGVLDSTSESNIIDHACDIHEPTIMVKGPRGHLSRSVTLEEATDTILFCSSIIHDVAYKAANIGMEKELMLLEGSRPMVTILGNSVSNQKDSRKMPDKNMPKSHKFKRKRLETCTKPAELGSNVGAEKSVLSNAETPNKVDNIKPPKLESKCNCTVM